MVRKTTRERNIDFLISHGWQVIPNARLSKYTQLSKPGVDYNYYLGQRSVRQGKSSTTSRSVKLKLGTEVDLKTKIIDPMFDEFGRQINVNQC